MSKNCEFGIIYKLINYERRNIISTFPKFCRRKNWQRPYSKMKCVKKQTLIQVKKRRNFWKQSNEIWRFSPHCLRTITKILRDPSMKWFQFEMICRYLHTIHAMSVNIQKGWLVSVWLQRSEALRELAVTSMI